MPLSLMRKAEAVLCSGMFSHSSATLYLDHRINPHVATKVGFNIEDMDKLPALVIIDFYDNDTATLILIQDVAKDGLLSDVKRDLILKLFDSNMITLAHTVHAFEDEASDLFMRTLPNLEKNSMAWFGNDVTNLPYLSEICSEVA